MNLAPRTSRSIWLTCYRTEEPEGRGLSVVLIDHPLASCLGHWDCQGDRFVELPPPGFHCDYGGNGYTVAKELGRELRGYGVSLQRGGKK